MARKKKNVKNRSGEGSFRVKENGKMEYRFSYRNELGKINRKSVTGIDELDCLNKAEMFLEKQGKLNMGIDMNATIPDIVRAKFDDDLRKNYVGEQGYCRNIATLRIIENSVLGSIPISEVKEAHIDFFLGTITSYSNSVISKVYQHLKMAYKIGIRKGIISFDIMDLKELRCPKSAKPNKKVRAYTKQEQERLVETLSNHKVPKNRNNYKNQVLIELYSGMRMGEINALKPEDIDWERELIHVRRTISRGLGYREFVKDGNKTAAGTRDIPMSKLLKPLLKEAVANMGDNPEGLIFYDYVKNSVVCTYQVNAFFKRICEKARLEFNGQHALRHTFATRCIEAGIQPVVLKNWLGHQNIHVTLDTYADVFDRMNFHAIEKLETYIEDII